MTNSTAKNLSPIVQFEPDRGRELAQEAGAGLTRERKRTERMKASLPRGISIGLRTDGREKPWFVRYGADRRTESFPTERDRNDRTLVLLAGVKEEGKAVLEFDPVEWKKYLLFRQETGVSLDEAKEIVLRVKGNLRLNLTFSEAADKYLELRAADNLSDYSHTKLHLTRFVGELGHLPLFAITPDHIRAVLKKFKEGALPGIPKLGALTLRHHRKTLHFFFERGKMEKWCLENPCSAVVAPKVAATETEILSAREVFDLLKANVNEPVVGRIVLELFGFMRCASVERVEPGHVKADVRGLEMPGHKHKSGRRKFRQGQLPVLWSWVEYCWPLPAPAEGPLCFVDITERNYDERKAEAFIRAGVKNSGNVLRHSCISYFLALSKNMPLASYLAQHTSPRMTERYEGVATDRDAALVAAMTPEAVMGTWEQLLASR